MLYSMSINLDEEKIKQLVAEIKRKKELKDLTDSFVREQLLKVLNQEAKLFNTLLSKFHSRSAAFKLTIKLVRAKLRRMHGLFRTEKSKIDDLVKEYLKIPSRDKLIQILNSHSSTKERIEFYPQLYQKIFAITGKPKGIIDLGCGINPFSIPLMGLERLNYSAYDLNQEEIGNLKTLFEYLHQKNKNIAGEAGILDFNQMERLIQIKKVDLCFMFKITDIIDQGKGHKKSEEVIKAIPTKYMVVSFPTLTMSGKSMNHPRRGWIELMCIRLGYEFKVLEFSNEIFYVVGKIGKINKV